MSCISVIAKWMDDSGPKPEVTDDRKPSRRDIWEYGHIRPLDKPFVGNVDDFLKPQTCLQTYYDFKQAWCFEKEMHREMGWHENHSYALEVGRET
ncbi:hypothetical protein NDU88_004908 [Pleurodeles waltl]|uniref:Uncharacterized protein n=1 Tax=Pleurodeles waltl TaxID=8319 RepID=A0AAV7NPX7_PLEWA|nr:hypothetical protein NDU88_004908 [Pleurodeles waltl]